MVEGRVLYPEDILRSRKTVSSSNELEMEEMEGFEAEVLESIAEAYNHLLLDEVDEEVW